MTTANNAVRIAVKRDNYKSVRSASGAKSLNNGDIVATITEGATLDELHVLGTNFLGEDTTDKYGHLNPGMQRMNIGNRIRGQIRKVDADNVKAMAKFEKDSKENPELQAPELTSGEDMFKAASAELRATVEGRMSERAAAAAKKAEEKEAAAKQKAADKEAAAKKKAEEKAAKEAKAAEAAASDAK